MVGLGQVVPGRPHVHGDHDPVVESRRPGLVVLEEVVKRSRHHRENDVVHGPAECTLEPLHLLEIHAPPADAPMGADGPVEAGSSRRLKPRKRQGRRVSPSPSGWLR